ncbi:MAG: hypothetical protein DRP82_03095, partial [Planctomycetota bacterium]
YYDGSSWHVETVYDAGDTGYYPRIAVDSNNIPHIVWYDKSTGRMMYAFWDSSASVWNDKGFLPANCSDNANLAIVVDSNDNPHLFYVNGRDLFHAYFDGTSWTTETVYTCPDGSVTDGWHSWTVAATIDSNDVVWVSGAFFWSSSLSHYGYSKLKIWKADLSSSPWTWNEVATLESRGYGNVDNYHPGKFAKFAFKSGVSSPFLIGWCRVGDEIKVYADTGSGYSHLYTVKQNVGGRCFCRLVFDSSGGIHTAWFNGNDSKVEYATKQGLSWVYDEVINSVDVNGLDMVVDSGDKLYVIFYDVANGCLKIATKQ